MGNGQGHPDEKKLAKKLGDDYLTENPPEGSRIVGEKDESNEAASESQPADQS